MFKNPGPWVLLVVSLALLCLVIIVVEVDDGKGPFVTGLMDECAERGLHLCRATECDLLKCRIVGIDKIGERQEFKISGPVLLLRGVFKSEQK
jgi:hypothetical protein